MVDMAYTPIIQSGGDFDLRPSAQSTGKAIHAGPIICSLGVRYRSYCSNIARTFLISPDKSVEINYKFLLQLQEASLNILTEGSGKSTLKDVYNKIVGYIKEHRPDLQNNLPKSFGFSVR